MFSRHSLALAACHAKYLFVCLEQLAIERLSSRTLFLSLRSKFFRTYSLSLFGSKSSSLFLFHQKLLGHYVRVCATEHNFIAHQNILYSTFPLIPEMKIRPTTVIFKLPIFPLRHHISKRSIFGGIRVPRFWPRLVSCDSIEMLDKAWFLCCSLANS